MARKRKIRVSEPVRIRTRQLQNGCESIYLDIYTEGRRRYEFLRLYLVPATDKAARTRNENTMRAANAIKEQRIKELTDQKAGIASTPNGGGITLGGLIGAYIQRKQGTAAERFAKSLLYHLENMNCLHVKLSDIDKRFCITLARKLNGLELKGISKVGYYSRLNAIFNDAVEHDLIASNPMQGVPRSERPQAQAAEREYLTADEVGKLIATPCRKEYIKRAFLFSCFSGLRKSDIELLTWGNLKAVNGHTEIRTVQKKTHNEVIIPLSPEAARWLPDRGGDRDSDKIFVPLLRQDQCILSEWIAAAGITKHITFHCARHTFATLLITLGADLYTVSKLLGHTNISTTQIYAKIVDSKRVEAISLFNGKFQ